MRASDWKAVNGFNEKFVWAFEDCSMSLSIWHNLNKKIVCCGETEIWHGSSETLKVNNINKLFQNHNIGLFKSLWKDKMDASLTKKYLENDNFNLYEKVK
jgi:hypothetical protein